MGSVWVADHLSLRTRVAVKFLASKLTSDEVVRKRFAREAFISAQVKHPHVVHVFDNGFTSDGVPFTVMELLEGEDLDHYLARVGTVGLSLLTKIITQTCKGLSKAHSMGLVHRDIKPANIFLTKVDGEIYVKILDFGIAKQQSPAKATLTKTGACLGTPYYMSPEQALNPRSADLRSDLWSIAIVGYRCGTGHLPFAGYAAAALARAVGDGAFARPSHINPSFPTALDAWFERALQGDPAMRFQSARDMADAFQIAAGMLKEAVSDQGGRGEAALHPISTSRPSELPPLTFAGSPSGSVQARKPSRLAWYTGATILAMSVSVFAADHLLAAEQAPTLQPLEVLAQASPSAPSVGANDGTPSVGAAEEAASASPSQAADKDHPIPSQAADKAHTAATDAGTAEPEVTIHAAELPTVRETDAAMKKGRVGKLSVGVRQGHCTVVVDGTSYGSTPIANVAIPAGIHRVVCRPPKGKSRWMVVVVEAQQTKRLVFNLAK